MMEQSLREFGASTLNGHHIDIDGWCLPDCQRCKAGKIDPSEVRYRRRHRRDVARCNTCSCYYDASLLGQECGDCPESDPARRCLGVIVLDETTYRRKKRLEDAAMLEPKVKFYQSPDGLGRPDTFATATTTADADEFLRVCAAELGLVLNGRVRGTEDAVQSEAQLLALLPQICQIWARLKGYKSEGVFEKRIIVAGTPNPEAHMEVLNAPTEAEIV